MTLAEILARKKAIKADVVARQATMAAEEVEAYSKELDELEKQEKEIRSKMDLQKRMEGIQTDVVIERTQEQPKDRKALRGAAYKMRTGEAIQLREGSTPPTSSTPSAVQNTSADGVLIPSHLDPVVGAFPWNEVSSIVDLVSIITLPNGNEYTKAYQISTGEADYTLEPTKTGDSSADKDGVYNEVSTAFDSVTIKRNKITALTYESEESIVMPDADYASLVEANVSLSIKKKIAKEIILGNGASNHFVGLASTALKANTYADKSVAVDENTILDTQIEYGGEEDVEGRQALLMNKLTLKDFLRVRGSDKKPVYTITFDGNTALIDGVRVVFTKHLKPYSTASSGEIWGIYGDFSKYYMLNFGGESIETSREFKFDQGITTVRGRVYTGGNAAAYKAFTRLKKPASI